MFLMNSYIPFPLDGWFERLQVHRCVSNEDVSICTNIFLVCEKCCVTLETVNAKKEANCEAKGSAQKINIQCALQRSGGMLMVNPQS